MSFMVPPTKNSHLHVPVSPHLINPATTAELDFTFRAIKGVGSKTPWTSCAHVNINNHVNININSAARRLAIYPPQGLHRRPSVASDALAYSSCRLALSLTMNIDHNTDQVLDAARHSCRIHLAGTKPLLAVWGGLGFTRRPLKELRDLLALHNADLNGFIQHCSAIFASLAHETNTEDGTKMSDLQADLFGYVRQASRRMPAATSLPPEVNSAITTILQLARYVLMCKRASLSPGDLARSCTAFAGHSLGMTVAFAMAAADSWSSLYELSEFAIRSVYWSCRSAGKTWGRETRVSDAIASECVRAGLGVPSPMLSITGLERSVVSGAIDALNKTIPAVRKLYLSLVNDSSSFVVSGGPEGLVVLAQRFHVQPSEVPGTSEDLRFGNKLHGTQCAVQFLANEAPYHCAHMQSALQSIQERLKRYTLRKRQLLVPILGFQSVFEELASPDDNLVPFMTKLIMSESLDWRETVESIPGRWQILDFGPGGLNGIGSLINRMKAGTSSSVFTVGSTDRLYDGLEAPLLSSVGGDSDGLVYEHVEFGKRCPLSRSKGIAFTTKMSDLIGLPRVLVAGMTPTTCDVGLVAEIANAGFYVEFACGGYNDAPSLTAALRDLAKRISPGMFINVNIIYANPRALTWQIPSLVSLVREGCPIGGLTIGAGVPDALIAGEYIRSLELSYIAFKPSTLAAIHNVLDIAKLHPTLPVLLQWTGGRSGGHHSMEDFHQALLQSYQDIRAIDNVVLIVGSGFGDVEGSWPYITGEWSQSFGRSSMPCDGVLIGTAIMSVLEAKTSYQAKQALVSASGTADIHWKGTLEGPTGGVISVISHLGEHMHVVATRGMQLWAELDKSIFMKSKKEMVATLVNQRPYYIKRLSDDFQKVWFAFDFASGQPLEDLEDMTYLDVLRRLLELLRPSTKVGWTHPTYEQLFDEFLLRALERAESDIQICKSHPTSPYERLEILALKVPELGACLLALEDVHFLIEICRRRGRKPVPFIIAFDEQFGVDFRKDPLWQAESLASTHHNDVGRVCILAGPVAIGHCKEVNVPVRQFLRGINSGFINHQNALEKTTQVSFLHVPLYGDDHRTRDIRESRIHVDEDQMNMPLEMPAVLPNERWLLIVGSEMCALGERFFGTRKLISNARAIPNPIRNLFAARPGATVNFSERDEENRASIAHYRSGTADAKLTIHEDKILLEMSNHCTRDRQPATFALRFKLDQKTSSIMTVNEGQLARLHDFYAQCLFGQDHAEFLKSKPKGRDHATVLGTEVDAWLKAVHHSSAFTDGQLLSSAVPLEYATIMGYMSWREVFHLPWDISKLLHLHTAARICEGQAPLQMGDRVAMHLVKTSVRMRDSGVEAHFKTSFYRESELALELDYSFIVLGEQVPTSECFEDEEESLWNMTLRSNVDKQILLAKSWIRPVASATIPIGHDLQFTLRRSVCYSAGSLVEHVVGEVCGQTGKENCHAEPLAHIKHTSPAATSTKNPVYKYLERANASGTNQRVQLPVEKLLLDKNGKPFKFKVPDNSREYAEAVGDYNPIHTTPSFAHYAGHERPICHGNHTTALVLAIIRREVPGASTDTIRAYTTENRAVVYPGDVLITTVKHIAMESGQDILKYEVRNEESGDVVLTGSVTLSGPISAFVFTGQGSQHPCMGLDLAAESRVSRSVWAHADRYLEENWGKLPPMCREYMSAILTTWIRFLHQQGDKGKSQDTDRAFRRTARTESPRQLSTHSRDGRLMSRSGRHASIRQSRWRFALVHLPKRRWPAQHDAICATGSPCSRKGCFRAPEILRACSSEICFRRPLFGRVLGALFDDTIHAIGVSLEDGLHPRDLNASRSTTRRTRTQWVRNDCR